MAHTDNNPLNPAMRHIIATANTTFRPYDRHGTVCNDMEYLPLSKEHNTNGAPTLSEVFLVRFHPGAASIPHEHGGGEQFYVLEGELQDSDGTTLHTGDFVHYKPGSRHYSTSEKGCTLLVILGGHNIPLSPPQ